MDSSDSSSRKRTTAARHDTATWKQHKARPASFLQRGCFLLTCLSSSGSVLLDAVCPFLARSSLLRSWTRSLLLNSAFFRSETRTPPRWTTYAHARASERAKKRPASSDFGNQARRCCVWLKGRTQHGVLIAAYLAQLAALGAAFALGQETLFGADLDQQRLQVGEELIVWELAHSHHPLRGIHIAESNHALAVGPGDNAHGHHSRAGLGPAAKENLLKLG